MIQQKNIIAFGATSSIAHEALKLFADDGSSFLLVGRDTEKLKLVQQDLVTRGAEKVSIMQMDADSLMDSQGEVLQKAKDEMGDVELALFAYGSLGEQDEFEKNPSLAVNAIKVNFLSLVPQLLVLAEYFQQQKNSGSVAVITSVAGDRGRQSNYVYGAAKGGLSIFLQGLRNRLAKDGVQVLDIKPGFVATPMTSHLKQGLLFASASSVGKGIYKAIEKRRDVVYLPWFWCYILLIIRMIPEKIFKKLKL